MKGSTLFVAALLSMLLAGATDCSRSGGKQRRHAEEIVREWTGKKIVLPDSLTLLDGSTYFSKDADFTIISYVDSAGCTGCHLKLPFWKEFLPAADSIAGNAIVRFLFVVQPKNIRDLNDIVDRTQFPYPVFADIADSVNKVNGFPEDMEYRTFLLDREHRVVALGNPVLNPAVKRIYLDRIGESDGAASGIRDTGAGEYSYSFGKIRPGEKAVHTFRLTNQTMDTLTIKKILTSCECTEAHVSETDVAPGAKYDVTVTFRDTIPGRFSREVYISYGHPDTETIFELTGEIL